MVANFPCTTFPTHGFYLKNCRIPPCSAARSAAHSPRPLAAAPWLGLPGEAGQNPPRIRQNPPRILQAPPQPTSTPAAPQLRTAQPVPGGFIWRRKAFAQVERTVSMGPRNVFTTRSSRTTEQRIEVTPDWQDAGSPAFYGILRRSTAFYAVLRHSTPTADRLGPSGAQPWAASCPRDCKAPNCCPHSASRGCFLHNTNMWEYVGI